MEDSCSYMNLDTFNTHMMILYDAGTVSVQVA